MQLRTRPRPGRHALIRHALIRAVRTLGVRALLPPVALVLSAASAETLHGRVYDSQAERIYPRVGIELAASPGLSTTTDAAGFFRFENVAPGAYLARLDLGEGESTLVARVVVHRGRATIHHFDVARIAAPHHDHDY